MSDRRPPPSAPKLSALEALEEARRAEAARRDAAKEADAKRELAQRLAEEARARFLEERAQKEAEEARLREVEVRREAARRQELARREALRRQEEAREAEEQMARDRAMASQPRSSPRTGPVVQTSIAEGRVRAVLKRLGDDFEILRVYDDLRPEVLAVLWQAQLKRARVQGDLFTVALALTIATRLEQHPDCLLAARVRWSEQEWAVWIDTERKEVLAALTPADRYLTGL